MRAYFRPLARVLVVVLAWVAAVAQATLIGVTFGLLLDHDRARRAGQGAACPMDLVLAGTVLAGFLGLVANGLIDTVQRTLLPWAPKGGAV